MTKNGCGGLSLQNKKGPARIRGRTLLNYALELIFGGLGIRFPFGSIGTKGELGIGVFQGDIVAGGIVGVEFEEIGDPIVGIVVFYLQQQVDG